MRLHEYDATLCNCCGLPVAEAHDKEQIFIVEENICYARRAIEKVRNKKREDAMRAKKGEGWDAGLKLYARAVTREQALKHMEQQHQHNEHGEGPRIAAAREQREQRERESTRRRIGAPK